MQADLDLAPLSAPAAPGELFITDWGQKQTLFLMTDMGPQQHAVALAQRGAALQKPYLVSLAQTSSVQWAAPAGMVVRAGHGARDVYPPVLNSFHNHTLLLDRGRLLIAAEAENLVLVDVATGQALHNVPTGFNTRSGIAQWSIQWVRADWPDVVLQTF